MEEHPTIDTRMVFRGMLVGLDEPSMAICKSAMRPLTAVIVADASEACRVMSQVLPLLVIMSGDSVTSDLADVTDVASACGAEVMSVRAPLEATRLTHQILEALRKGEKRRVGR